MRLFISYSHKDENLRIALGDHLAQMQREGVIAAWDDRKITAGQEWAGEISSKLEAADIILCLVSAGFLASPYCNEKELQRALERHDAGEALVIPVILKPAAWETSPLGRLQALPANARAVTLWSNRDQAFTSVAQGIRKAAQKLSEERPQQVSAPLSPPPPTTRASTPAAPPGGTTAPTGLDNPEGPVRADSAFYIHPADEARCCAELDKPGALIRIKSPKGFGKSSLTAQLLAYANGKGYRTVALNMEGTDQKFFADPELFMQWFCAAVGKRLGLQVPLENYWNKRQGANDNCTDFFEDYLLKPDATPLVLVIDNFDRIFEHAVIETDFCGLLRSWYESKYPLWERFRLVISHSKESYLQKDINQSPFNVGLPVQLDGLTPEQVSQLLVLHGLSLSDMEVNQLIDMVGGHPYLVRKALYELANGLPFATFLREAPTEAGVFADHLRGILKAVEDHPDLKDAVRLVLNSVEPVKLRSVEAFKLESLGILIPEVNLARLRCRLYTTYLTDQLED